MRILKFIISFFTYKSNPSKLNKILWIGSDYNRVYLPRELRELGCEHFKDTIEEKEYKSLWTDEEGRLYKCTHSSKSRVDHHGRDIRDGKNIVDWI